VRRLALLVVTCLALAACAPSPKPAPSGVAPTAAGSGFAIYQGLGFDACNAPTTSTMSAWLASPYRAIGIYIGGANRFCAVQANLTPSWVTTVEGQGWKLLPLYVGSQAPSGCGVSGHLISTNLATAASQGTTEANDAADQADALALGSKTPIFFDLEAYTRSGTCSPPVKAFIDAWVRRLHVRGYFAGFYSSSGSGVVDQAQFVKDPNYARPDYLWFANWNNNTSVFGDPFFSDSLWNCHQRHHQYRGGHDETYGGVTINIDNDSSDGAVAGAPHSAKGPAFCWSR
jgi:glycoside hydrolase-like protein